MTRYLIVGAGVSGMAAAEAIRRADPRGEITLVIDDPFGFYSRPGLAYYLSGEVTEPALFPPALPTFQKLSARLITARAAALDPDGHRLRLEDGRELPYDRLLLATGSLAVPLPVPGGESIPALKLDNLSDARRILAAARSARSAVVVGGGITALEIVEGLSARGVPVHYLLRGERVWPAVLDEEEARLVEAELRRHGIRLHTNSEVTEVEHRGSRVQAVITRSGQRIPCDLLAVAIGVRPRMELAAAAGLQVERGIRVNLRLQTSRPDIYAAGDVAQIIDPATGASHLNALWGLGRRQGAAAGRNMAGGDEPYPLPPPFNITRLGGLVTTVIGAVGRQRRAGPLAITRGESEAWQDAPESVTIVTGDHGSRTRILVGERQLVGAVVMGDQLLSRPLLDLVGQCVDISAARPELLHPAQAAGAIQRLWEKWKRTHARPQP